MKRECETCIKRKTIYCPTSMECMATDDMPYYQNRIMLLNENQELKLELSGYRQAILNNKEMLGLKEENDKLKKQLEQYQEEVCILDMRTDENIKLIKENHDLKKQLDKYKGSHYCSFIDICKSTKIANYNQQKEFIKYLESKIVGCEIISDSLFNNNKKMKVYKEILQKYKELVGDINDKK